MVWRLLEYRGAFSKAYASCDARLKVSIDRRMAQLLEQGNQTKFPVSRPLGNGLFELRASTGREHIRFLYFFASEQRIVFILAAPKDQRRLPKRILKQARDIKDTLKAAPELMDGLVEVH